MKRYSKFLAILALASPLASCLNVDHFTEDASRYDNLYFGPRDRAPLRPQMEDDQWRLYALLGLIAWEPKQLEFAGTALERVAPDEGAMNVSVTTELTFINGLANLGISFIPFGTLLLETRSTQVIGWTEGASADASPDS